MPPRRPAMPRRRTRSLPAPRRTASRRSASRTRRRQQGSARAGVLRRSCGRRLRAASLAGDVLTDAPQLSRVPNDELRAGMKMPCGVAIAAVEGGRGVVQTEDPALIARMEAVEMCGTPARLAADHSFVI